MPLQDLLGSLDNLAGGALSDALSKAAESTSLDETLGNALSGFQDIAGNAEELSAGAEEAISGAQDAFSGVADSAAGDFVGVAEELSSGAEGFAQEAVTGFEDVAQGSVDQVQEGLNGVIDGFQGNVSDITDAIPDVGDLLGGLFNRQCLITFSFHIFACVQKKISAKSFFCCFTIRY